MMVKTIGEEKKREGEKKRASGIEIEGRRSTFLTGP